VQAVAVAMLATNFVMYRTGLLLVDYHQPCSCLGTLTDGLHISPQKAGVLIELILVYLLVGSYSILGWLGINRWKLKYKTATS